MDASDPLARMMREYFVKRDNDAQPRIEVEAIQKAVTTFGQIIEALATLAYKAMVALEPYAEQIKAAAEHYPNASLLEKAGWLPHETFPIHLLNEYRENIPALNQAITQHYADHWEKVRDIFEATLLKRSVDDQARRLFNQALTAHQMGLYALVPRAIFPELERISRIKFSQPPRARVTSQKSLKEFVGTKLSLRDVSPGGIYGLTLFGKFFDHVYNDVDDETYDAMKNEAVPNRHAALHGWFDYDNVQSSLNALIMADYIFYLFDVIENDASRVGDE